MAWVYILECADGSLYVGSTTNLGRRVEQHQTGQGSAYTRRPGRLPVSLRWAQRFDRVDAAFHFEKQLQGWGRAKRLALIEGRLEDLPALARGRTGRPSERLDKLDDRRLEDRERPTGG
jgi:putative endonuclease